MDYYNSLSKGYNALHKEEQLRKLATIKEYLPKGALILDVGCGTGLSSMLGDIIGIDPSRQLLIQAQFPTVEGIAESLPFKDCSFDAVISVTALHHCTDVKKAIGEMRRVSKGTIIISTLKKAKQYAALELEIANQLHIIRAIDDSIDTIYVCTI